MQQQVLDQERQVVTDTPHPVASYVVLRSSMPVGPGAP